MEILIKIAEIVLGLFSTSPLYIRLPAYFCIIPMLLRVVLYLVKIDFNEKLTESVLHLLRIRTTTMGKITLLSRQADIKKEEETKKLKKYTFYVDIGIIASFVFLLISVLVHLNGETTKTNTMTLTMGDRHHQLVLTNLAERIKFDPSGREEIFVNFTDMKDDTFKLNFVIKGGSERVYAKNEADDDIRIEMETNSGRYTTNSRADCIIKLKTDDSRHYSGEFEIREIYDADNNYGHQENIVGNFNFVITDEGEKTLKDEDAPQDEHDGVIPVGMDNEQNNPTISEVPEEDISESPIPQEPNSTDKNSKADEDSLPTPPTEPSKTSDTKERVFSSDDILESPVSWIIVIVIFLFIRYATDWDKVTAKLKEFVERIINIFKTILVCGSVLGILYILSISNSTNDSTAQTTIKITSLNSEMYLSAGDNFTAALLESGQTIAKGDNRHSQHEHIDEGWDEWKNLRGISAGHHHTVGLTQDRTVVFDGSNDNNQCEIDLSVWSDLTMISAGGFHTVGLKSDGTVVAVGGNESAEDIANNIQINYGQCEVSGDDWKNIVQISAGWYHTVGLRKDGSVVAVGCDKNGDQRCRTESWSNMIGISAGRYHTVGITSDHHVIAIGGNNDYGERNTDTQEWKDIVAVSAGCWHTVGLRDDGTVVAVGDNRYHQCEVNPENGWTDIVAISTGCWHTVGLRKDGTIVSTGRNRDSDFGQANLEEWKGIKRSEELLYEGVC